MTQPLPIYVGPELPRWTPRIVADVQNAIDDGLLRETHWLDVKLEIGTSDGAKKETARDMASYANDGGAIIIGIREDKRAGTMAIEPLDLKGLPERLDEIARSRCDRPLYIRCHSIPLDSDPNRGLLLIEIPPSALAPHMVDGRYYGRGDTTKRILTDAEVERFHAARSMRQFDAEQMIDREIARDPVPQAARSRGHIYVVAQPLATPRDWLTDAIEKREVTRVLQSVADRLPSKFSPSLRAAGDEWFRAEGVGLSSQGLIGRQMAGPEADEMERDLEQGLVDLEVSDDGQVAFFCGRATDKLHGYRHQYVLDAGIAEYVRGSVELAADLGSLFGYGGRWTLAVGVTDLQGLISSAVFDDRRPSTHIHRFTTDRYVESTESDTAELRDRPGTITYRLMRRLMRGLGRPPASYGGLLQD